MLDIALYDETDRVKQQYLSIIRDLIKATSKKIGLSENYEVSIVIVDNQKIKQINEEYRKINQVTDVISFALEDDVEDESDHLFEMGMEDVNFELPKLLGDIFISFDKAEEQAHEYGHSLIRELGFLTVHGFLHLNGYDHQNENEEKVMLNLQNEILEENNLER